MKPTDLYVLAGMGLLFAVMAVSFVDLPWKTGQAEVPISDNGSAGQTSVARTLFGEYAVTLPLIALVLGACMVGGIYLAKQEDQK